MTRLILLPVFLCLSLLSYGQTSQTRTASLVSSDTAPNGSSTSTTPLAPSADTVKPAKTVSRGIIPPKLIHTIAMKDNGNQHVHMEGRQRIVTVYLTVNEAGEPTDLHIPEPVDEALDAEVLATVGKFRYQPGLLDGKPASMPVHMHYVVPVGAIY